MQNLQSYGLHHEHKSNSFSLIKLKLFSFKYPKWSTF